MRKEPMMNQEDHDINVEVTPASPDPAVINAASCALLEHSQVREQVRETRHRLLSFDLLDPVEKMAAPKAPGRFRAAIYDYTNNRTLLAEGCLDEPEILVV